MIGVIIACRWDIGSQPSESDLLHISVINGNSSGRNSLRMVVGIGSNEHDFDFVDMIMVRISSELRDSNMLNSTVGGYSLVVGWLPPVDRRMVSIFCRK